MYYVNILMLVDIHIVHDNELVPIIVHPCI